jgi:integrase
MSDVREGVWSMGSLIQRDNQMWYGVFCHKGKRVWRSTGTQVRGEAEVVFSDLEGQFREKKKETVLTFSSDFFERSGSTFALKTLEIYRRSFSNLIRLVGDLRIDKLGPREAELFRSRRATEVSPVTVNIELKTLRAAFNDAKRLKVIIENPFDAVKKLRVPYKEASCLEEIELKALLGAIQDPDFRNLIIFAVFTMMRLGEIMNLKWREVDLNRRIIHIRDSEGFQVKGGKPRKVEMSNWVESFLASKVHSGNYVFCGVRGVPLKGQSVSQRFRRLVRSQGYPKGLHFHSLRHTGISMLANRNVPLVYIQRLAGHSSPLVTQVYTHIDDKNLSLAVNMFPQLL